ncbi:MAG: transposase [Bacteroidota bacterium]|jgi:putative transposase|nr:transposase [Cytophagales bacterium]MCE2955587.1 transposase [Flammeovirgaceae bacterium]MCZ8071287.1 transposase [Cytophagales bacterium]
MFLTEGDIYHVFNRGNNRQPIFFRAENYDYFLKNINRYLTPVCDILAWCLMPNHFHLLIHANQQSTQIIKDGSFERQQFSQGIKQLLSSYTKATNKQEGRTGSLFQQKTKALHTEKNYHSQTTFHYIHQNPMKAGLVKKMEDWPHSSFIDYLDQRESICNTELARELLNLNASRFYEDSYQVINFKLIEFD